MASTGVERLAGGAARAAARLAVAPDPAAGDPAPGNRIGPAAGGSPSGEPGGTGPEGPSTTPVMEPILVRGSWGRVGSTLLMQLLGTSTDISFDRIYPFENRVLSCLLHYLAPLAGPVPMPNGYWMDDPEKLWWVDPDSFGFRFGGDPFPYPELGVDRSEFHRRIVRASWEAYGRTAPRPGDHRPRYYAEKYGGRAEDLLAARIPVRMVNLVRDPRDTWASVLAFDAKRGYYGFGRRDAQTHDEYRASYIEAVRRRLDEMTAVLPGVPATTVRYEDMVADLAGEARRLGSWLGVDLDAGAVEANRDSMTHHMTTDSVDRSVERWRQDLPAEDIAEIDRALGAHYSWMRYPPG